VRPDGAVTLPLIGTMQAAGKTASALQREIAARYKQYVRSEPDAISVSVSSIKSYQFTVTGNVERTGLYTSRTYLSALEALAMAGGPNRFAGSSFYILRGNPPRRIPIDLNRASTPNHAEQNVTIIRGDVLVVP